MFSGDGERNHTISVIVKRQHRRLRYSSPLNYPAGQRSGALGFEAGRAWREKWEETSGGCDGAKAGRVAASPVGERRGLRAAPQELPGNVAGSRIVQVYRIGKLVLIRWVSVTCEWQDSWNQRMLANDTKVTYTKLRCR